MRNFNRGRRINGNRDGLKACVHRTTVSRLLNGKAGISPDMALWLSKLLTNTDIQFWLNLQRDYDIWTIQQYGNKLHIKPLDKAALGPLQPAKRYGIV